MEKEKSNELRDAYDFGGYLDDLSRKILLRAEMLRGISKVCSEYDSQESQEIYLELGLELNQIGQQLKLLRDHLCHRCEMLQVEEKTIILSERMPVKEEKAGGK